MTMRRSFVSLPVYFLVPLTFALAPSIQALEAKVFAIGDFVPSGSGGCNGADSSKNQQGTCGPKGGAMTTCFLTTGCSMSNAPASPLALVMFGLVLTPLFARRMLRRRTRR